MHQQSSRQFFNGLNIIYTALCLGQLLFLMISYIVVSKNPSKTDVEMLTQVLKIVTPVLAFAGLSSGLMLFNQRLKKIRSQQRLSDKLTHYRTAVIIRSALWEAPSLFAIVCYVLTSNYLFPAITLVIIVLFMLHRPTKEKIVNDLQLTESEIALLEDPDATITA